MTTMPSAMLLKLVAVLWVVWGAVHALAGVLTISQSAPGSISGIADAVDPSVFHATYHAATDALINQHGFNLLWIGVFTVIGGVFIWRASAMWLLFTAVVGGLTDVGYFVFMDLGGHVGFVPGTVMTLVSSAAVLLSAIVYFGNPREAETAKPSG